MWAVNSRKWYSINYLKDDDDDDDDYDDGDDDDDNNDNNYNNTNKNNIDAVVVLAATHSQYKDRLIYVWRFPC